MLVRCLDEGVYAEKVHVILHVAGLSPWIILLDIFILISGTKIDNETETKRNRSRMSRNSLVSEWPVWQAACQTSRSHNVPHAPMHWYLRSLRQKRNGESLTNSNTEHWSTTSFSNCCHNCMVTPQVSENWQLANSSLVLKWQHVFNRQLKCK